MVRLSKMGKYSSPKIIWVPVLGMEGGKQGYSLCARLGITSKFWAFVFVLFKTGQRGCTRIDHGPEMDEWNADDIGMPRMHAP